MKLLEDFVSFFVHCSKILFRGRTKDDVSAGPFALTLSAF